MKLQPKRIPLKSILQYALSCMETNTKTVIMETCRTNIILKYKLNFPFCFIAFIIYMIIYLLRGCSHAHYELLQRKDAFLLKKPIHKTGILLLAAVMLFSFLTTTVHADAGPGDVIVTLGEDLTAEQKQTVLKDMGIENENDVEIVYVTNKEEHNYLGSYIPAAQIGSNAISSARITFGQSNSGLAVETKNINYITEEMYINPLATAGVTDAQIYVTAPFSVSGTGALTGILKAYEVSTGEKIDEDVKQAANEEMVVTSDLSKDENIGEDKALELMNLIKEEMAEKNPQTEAEIREMIKRLAAELGINLTDAQLDQLVSLFNKLKGLNIDWDKVNDTINTAKNKVQEFAQTEEGQNIINSFLNFLKSIWDSFISIFTK